MTTTFLGKWRFSFQGVVTEYFVAYRPHREYALGDLYFYGDPPGRNTNFAFVRGSDSKLYFQLNNGKYVRHSEFLFLFADTLAEAVNFSFPGQENFGPPSFKSKVAVGTDRFMVHPQAAVLADVKTNGVGYWTVSQVTPSLADLQIQGNGDGFDFAWVDLTGGTLDKVSLIGSDFSNCNLTNFKFLHCAMKKAILTKCIPTGADFTGSVLAGANLNQVDLTGVLANAPLPEFYVKPLQPPSLDNPRTTLNGSVLKHSLLGNDWSMLDLSGTTIVDLAALLSSQANPLQAKYSILTGLNQNNLSNLSLPYARFDNAMLDNVNLNGADLSNASLVQASMHNTALSNATLKNANMTGAQLGGLDHLFTLPAGYETHLNAGPKVDDALRTQFAQHGIRLSANAEINTQAPNRVWELKDVDSYTIRLEGDSSPALIVFGPSVSASLVNAYMPNAVLTGANLFGVIASGAQFYGGNARLDGSAILEKVEFNDANLSSLNLTQANLFGANLSGAHLFNAKFNKARLTPSADGVPVNLSNANLQGACFTDAQLDGANLSNAAVAIKVPTRANPQQGGVYLFSMPSGSDTHTLQQYTTELSAAAATFLSFNPHGDATLLQKYLTAVKNNDIATLRVPFLKLKPPVTISTNAQVKVVKADSVWQIVDGTKSYTVWINVDEESKTELYAASSLTITQAGFSKRSMTLRWQASAAVDTTDQQWLLDNDSENPKNFSTGYAKFVVKLNGKVLDVYGTALRILRMGDNNQEEFDTETCQITMLSKANLTANTICPNGGTVKVNSDSGKDWELWLRAPSPPRPPDCVPTPNNWCPPPTKKKG